MMDYKDNYGGIDFEIRDHIAILTFNNPKTLNALSYSVFKGIREVFSQMSRDKDIYGVILTGAGRSFIAGADLSDATLNDANDSNLIDLRTQRIYIHDTMNVIASFERPTLAAVNGYALGGGAELALCCDFRFGSRKAKVGFPETKLGGIPGYGGPTRAVRIMGITNAKEMLLTGAHFPADEALRLGFFSKVFEPEELMEGCMQFMRQIAAQAPIAVRYAKFLADRSVEMSEAAALEFERFVTMTTTQTNDFTEGMAAFHEKREPHFTNS